MTSEEKLEQRLRLEKGEEESSTPSAIGRRGEKRTSKENMKPRSSRKRREKKELNREKIGASGNRHARLRRDHKAKTK